MDGQPGISAITLPGLDLLRDDTEWLHLPETHDGIKGLDVRVPTLGAYVVNKAATFMERGGRKDDDGNPKLAKDLLYLCDLMAAGPEVVARIEDDVERIASEATRNAETVRTGSNHLSLIISGGSSVYLQDVGRMLVERERSLGLSKAVERARGYLTDLHEILSDTAGRYTRDADLQ